MFVTRVRSLVRNLLRRNRIERELDAELQGALEGLIDEHVRRGMSAADACRAALQADPPVRPRYENGFSSAVGPYIDGNGTSCMRRYTLSCPRW